MKINTDTPSVDTSLPKLISVNEMKPTEIYMYVSNTYRNGHGATSLIEMPPFEEGTVRFFFIVNEKPYVIRAHDGGQTYPFNKDAKMYIKLIDVELSARIPRNYNESIS